VFGAGKEIIPPVKVPVFKAGKMLKESVSK